MILFIDAETTGIPNNYAPIEVQPYVVQIAADLCDDSGKSIAQINRIIRPAGWTIPYEATAIHGLTTEHCLRNGVPLEIAMKEIEHLWFQATRVVAYNVTFDDLMIRLSAQRCMCSLPRKDLYCAMRESAKLISDSGRWLKLGVAYRCFFGQEPAVSHDAMADVEACKRIYFALQERLAPVTRLVGNIQGISKAKLQKMLSGAKEVEEHQQLLSSLVKLHCSPLPSIDWETIARIPDPIRPEKSSKQEQAARERLRTYRPNFFQKLFDLDSKRIAQLEEEVVAARSRDDQQYKQSILGFESALASLNARRLMARRILSGDLAAYGEVMDNCDIGASPLLGRQIVHTFIDSQTVEAFVYMNGADVIPEQTKSLLASGRVSVKKAKKKEFTLLYQDHVCSAALRVARDFMAMLPASRILIHGFAPAIDSATGTDRDRCLLSCVLEREKFKHIDFEHVDPSDCASSFTSAMEISKGVLQEIQPLQLTEKLFKRTLIRKT